MKTVTQLADTTVTGPSFGTFTPPDSIATSVFGSPDNPGGLLMFFNNVLRIVFLLAGLYAVANIFLAGIMFVNARGDAKQIEAAWYKIWQSLAGLAVVMVSFLAAVILGQVLFGNPGALLELQLIGPGTQTPPTP